MKRLAVAGTLLGVLFLLSAGVAEAQIFNNPNRTYSVGDSAGSGRYFSGLGLGVLPLNYRGGYSNDPSLMSPPSRSTNTAPFFGMGLGWFGKRSPSPRPEPNYSYNPPVNLNTTEPPLFDTPGPMLKTQPIPVPEPAPTPKPEPIAAPMDSITVEVRVPTENAAVFVNNTATKQTGMVRIFASPPLATKDRYQYEIRVQWTANGKDHVVRQTITGVAGDKLVADFSK